MTAYDYSSNSTTNGGEHRQRCCNNHGNGSEVPSAVAAAAASAAAIRSTTTTTTTEEDDLDDQKYDKRAKARLQRRRRKVVDVGSQSYYYSFFSSSPGGKRPPSVAQIASLLLLFTALLSMWHYMRTVWWTHGRLAAAAARHRHVQEEHMTIYQLAEARIKEHHQMYTTTTNNNNNKHADNKSFGDAGKESYRQRHEQRNKRIQQQRQQQQEQHRFQKQQQQQQQRDDGQMDESNSNIGRRRRRHDDDDDEEQQQQSSPRQGEDEGQRAIYRHQDEEEDEDADTEMDMEYLEALSTNRIQQLFLQERKSNNNSNTNVKNILMVWLQKLNHDVLSNVHGGIRWIRPYLLPPLPGLSKTDDDKQRENALRKKQRKKGGLFSGGNDSLFQRQFFRVDRMMRKATTSWTAKASSSAAQFTWEDEWNDLIQQQQQHAKKEKDAASAANNNVDLDNKNGDATTKIARKLAQPLVDYTDKKKYRYPPLREPPPDGSDEYPQLTTLASMMEHWDQDQDFSGIITETLLHFNYSDPIELEMARKFRDAELPFKLINVPELDAANLKWTDEYISKQFDRGMTPRGYLKNFFHSKTQQEKNDPDLQGQPASGLAQESPNHYFAFFSPPNWHVEIMGIPPVRNNDWTFWKWSEHARYADAIHLSPDQPHFYWQAGVDKEERHSPQSRWTFISRDLPSWSSPNPTFMVFNPKEQKGIQCRFGERGVVAATHYDSGRNMVGMITGAKRYILSPPRACSRLGIFTHQKSPIWRHSLLNFGHLKYLNNDKQQQDDDEENQMSMEERAWLERASQAEAVETVLKAGEVLYIPSFWFHYIISLQKSAQCNVRSGIGHDGSGQFGGHEDVVQCVD